MVELDEAALRALVLGGAVLGGGGGGSIEDGLDAGRRALARGKPKLAELSEVEGDEPLVTLSRMGSTSGDRSPGGMQTQELRALRLFVRSGENRIAGFLASEVGPLAVTYGWYLSAMTGIPVVDAPCNGRAHPLGTMGSLGLHHFPRHVTTTAAVGGPGRGSRSVELLLRANAQQASDIVRAAVEKAGVPVAVVRNPLPVSYVQRHAAIGALRFARMVGEVMERHRGGGINLILDRLATTMHGEALVSDGVVRTVELEEKGGFTVGRITIRSEMGTRIVVPVCNEYMAALSGSEVLGVFPDLISLFDSETALPLGSAQIRESRRVAVFFASREHIPLGYTMRDDELLRPVERLLGIRLSRHPARSFAPAVR
jgi:DUF917 family protein